LPPPFKGSHDHVPAVRDHERTTSSGCSFETRDDAPQAPGSRWSGWGVGTVEPSPTLCPVKFKKGETVIYPQHGACIVVGTKKMEAFGAMQEYLILKTVINEMTLSVPVLKAEEVGVRPPVSPDELDDLVSVLAKPDPRVPSNWSRRFKNHQEKLKSGDVYQVAEVVRNLAARNRDASLSAAERTMYDRARINLVSEIAPALKVSAEEAERFLDEALAKGVLKPAKEPAKKK
jgi:CarD family transcriptional regulator